VSPSPPASERPSQRKQTKSPSRAALDPIGPRRALAHSHTEYRHFEGSAQIFLNIDVDQRRPPTLRRDESLAQLDIAPSVSD